MRLSCRIHDGDDVVFLRATAHVTETNVNALFVECKLSKLVIIRLLRNFSL